MKNSLLKSIAILCLLRKYPYALVDGARELIVLFCDRSAFYKFCNFVSRREKKFAHISQCCEVNHRFYGAVSVVPAGKMATLPDWHIRYALADKQTQKLMRTGRIA